MATVAVTAEIVPPRGATLNGTLPGGAPLTLANARRLGLLLARA